MLGKEATRENLRGRCQDISYLSKTRRFRQLSANTEDFRTLRVREPSQIYFLGDMKRPRERWKETAEGRAEVGRLWAFWSADPTQPYVGFWFTFCHVFSRV